MIVFLVIYMPLVVIVDVFLFIVAVIFFHAFRKLSPRTLHLFCDPFLMEPTVIPKLRFVRLIVIRKLRIKFVLKLRLIVVLNILRLTVILKVVLTVFLNLSFTVILKRFLFFYSQRWWMRRCVKRARRMTIIPHHDSCDHHLVTITNFTVIPLF